MVRKKIIVFILFTSLLVSVGFTQDGPGQKQMDYTGSWASNYLDTTTTAYTTFVHIEKISNDRYFIISFSNESSFYTFIGGGFVRPDGYLQVTTDTGEVYLFTPAHIRGYSEAMSMSNLDNVESFAGFVRLSRKFTEWPFPEEGEK